MHSHIDAVDEFMTLLGTNFCSCPSQQLRLTASLPFVRTASRSNRLSDLMSNSADLFRFAERACLSKFSAVDGWSGRSLRRTTIHLFEALVEQ